ncbi:ABC transporter permease subunit [Halovulum dunhuangense]|uniref:ABC transporter permease subunit n=2 Tax=Halovulum dunhuangense TaxID=1505036 RepID=A0A849L759_9RHOB|nr:ABC transporter permease subunit [Halovulum dunhuangense]NNU82093.1 ABC transporter permease subunit [Halovulum dunhuangense]
MQPPRQPFWTRSRIRSAIIQVGFVALLAFFVHFLLSNTMTNLARQGIASGFGFLENRAGFDIAISFLDFGRNDTYMRAFWTAVVNTLVLSVLGIALATVIGFMIGLARVSPNWLISRLAAVYIETFRNIPLLLQLFFWYFAILRPLPGPRDSLDLAGIVFLSNRGLYLPKPLLDAGAQLGLAALGLGLVIALVMARRARRYRAATGQPRRVAHWWFLGLVVLPSSVWLATGARLDMSMPELQGFNFRGGMVVLPEMLAAILGLSIYIAAAVGEIVRAGIQGIDHGQTEAAQAMGHTRGQIMRYVVIPQAMRIIIPPLTTQYQSLAKNTSLASAIAFPEIISIIAGTTMTQTGQAVETIALAMLFYLTVSLFIAAVMNFFNWRVTRLSF